MKSLVRPELPTASACSSQATSAAVDNSAPVQTRPFSLIYRGLAVQTNRATSVAKAMPVAKMRVLMQWLDKAMMNSEVDRKKLFEQARPVAGDATVSVK
jgi:hypothetical protein